LFLYGEQIFSFIFGENWKEAGLYSEIMAPWLMINFILSPISQIPTVLKRQKTFFILSSITTLVLIFSLVINFLFPNLNLVFRDVLMFISYGQFICLSFLLFWTMKIIKE
jgi:O-antigen/teichoic acid export membrane protein